MIFTKTCRNSPIQLALLLSWILLSQIYQLKFKNSKNFPLCKIRNRKKTEFIGSIHLQPPCQKQFPKIVFKINVFHYAFKKSLPRAFLKGCEMKILDQLRAISVEIFHQTESLDTLPSSNYSCFWSLWLLHNEAQIYELYLWLKWPLRKQCLKIFKLNDRPEFITGMQQSTLWSQFKLSRCSSRVSNFLRWYYNNSPTMQEVSKTFWLVENGFQKTNSAWIIKKRILFFSWWRKRLIICSTQTLLIAGDTLVYCLAKVSHAPIILVGWLKTISVEKILLAQKYGGWSCACLMWLKAQH